MGNSFHKLSPSPVTLLQNFPPITVYPVTLFTLSFVKVKLLCLTKFNTSTFPSQTSVWVAYLRHSAQAKIMKRAASLGLLFLWASELHLKLIPIYYVKRDFFFNVVTWTSPLPYLFLVAPLVSYRSRCPGTQFCTQNCVRIHPELLIPFPWCPRCWEYRCGPQSWSFLHKGSHLPWLCKPWRWAASDAGIPTQRWSLVRCHWHHPRWLLSPAAQGSCWGQLHGDYENLWAFRSQKCK